MIVAILELKIQHSKTIIYSNYVQYRTESESTNLKSLFIGFFCFNTHTFGEFNECKKRNL